MFKKLNLEELAGLSEDGKKKYFEDISRLKSDERIDLFSDLSERERLVYVSYNLKYSNVSMKEFNERVDKNIEEMKWIIHYRRFGMDSESMVN